MDYNAKAIEYLIRFRNCKVNETKTPKILDQGMNYILMIMADGKPKTASYIAEDMNVSMARVTALIQKMEEKGLVNKETSIEDKRVSYITLTELGKKNSCDLLQQSIKIISELIGRVGEQRIDDFLDTLYVLKDILEEKDGEEAC